MLQFLQHIYFFATYELKSWQASWKALTPNHRQTVCVCKPSSNCQTRANGSWWIKNFRGEFSNIQIDRWWHRRPNVALKRSLTICLSVPNHKPLWSVRKISHGAAPPGLTFMVARKNLFLFFAGFCRHSLTPHWKPFCVRTTTPWFVGGWERPRKKGDGVKVI